MKTAAFIAPWVILIIFFMNPNPFFTAIDKLDIKIRQFIGWLIR